jgi:ferric-dicitrate binding protein FerR (iron transport regulator)
VNLARLDELCDRWRDGRLDEEQTRELNTLLRISAAARERFRAQAHFHGLLHSAVASASVENALTVVTGGQSLRRRWFAAPLRFAAAVLALAVGAGVVTWQMFGQATIGPVVATLGDHSGVRLSYVDGTRLPTANGQELHAATYRLDAGIMQVVYDNGAKVLVQAPARFELATNQLLRLQRGRLSARVPEAAIGFIVETPTAKVVDLGTEFGVTAGENDSEVHVFEGEVLVKTANEPDPLRLRENRASRIDQATGTPTGVDFRPEGFVRTLSEPSGDLTDRLRHLAPIALYRMTPTDDGRTLRDERSDGYHGQVFTAPGRIPWASGFKGGMALSLGGGEAGTYAVVPAFPTCVGGNLTVCAWVYANRRPRWASIVKNWAKDAKVNNGGQFHFGLFKDDGDLEAHVHDANGQEVQVRENQPLPLDHWHVVAFTLDGHMLRLYRNGIEVAAAPCNGLWQTGPRALGIGVKLRDEIHPDIRNTGYWDGRLDNVAIFHRALSAAEIASLSE